MKNHKLFLVAIKREFEMFVCAEDEKEAKRVAETNMAYESLSSDDEDNSLRVASIRRYKEEEIASSRYDLDDYVPWCEGEDCITSMVDSPVAEWFATMRWARFSVGLPDSIPSLYLRSKGPIEWDLIRDRNELIETLKVSFEEINEFENKNQTPEEIALLASTCADDVIKRARKFWPEFEKQSR